MRLRLFVGFIVRHANSALIGEIVPCAPKQAKPQITNELSREGVRSVPQAQVTREIIFQPASGWRRGNLCAASFARATHHGINVARQPSLEACSAVLGPSVERAEYPVIFDVHVSR